jgi:putative transposase
MRQAALKPVWKRKFVHTKNSRHDMPITANVLDRQFNPPARNRAYVGDITYIRTGAGWLYPAIVIDLYSRKLVGRTMVPSMPAKLVCDARNWILDSDNRRQA